MVPHICLQKGWRCMKQNLAFGSWFCHEFVSTVSLDVVVQKWCRMRPITHKKNRPLVAWLVHERITTNGRVHMAKWGAPSSGTPDKGLNDEHLFTNRKEKSPAYVSCVKWRNWWMRQSVSAVHVVISHFYTKKNALNSTIQSKTSEELVCCQISVSIWKITWVTTHKPLNQNL